MKKIYGPLWFFILFLFFVPNVPAADLEGGFLGIQWGEAVSSVQGLSLVNKSNQVAYYVRPNVVYKLKKRHLSQVAYGFYTDKFFAGYVSFDSWGALSDIRNNLKKQYGPPKIKMTKDRTVYRWKYGDIKIKLKVWEIKEAMKLAIYYLPLSDKLNEESQEKNFDNSLETLPNDKNKKSETVPLNIY